MAIFTFVVNIYMAIVMVSFRIHYTIDIIIGVAIGHYWFVIFNEYNESIDKYVKFAIGNILNRLIISHKEIINSDEN